MDYAGPSGGSDLCSEHCLQCKATQRYGFLCRHLAGEATKKEMNMEQITNLEAAVLAAGIATAYVADEWALESPAAAEAAAAEGPQTQH